MLPTSLVIDDAEYRIDPSFENCLNIIQMYEDPELLDSTKVRTMIQLLFLDPPPLTTETLKEAVAFLDGGNDSVVPKAVANASRVFSFDQDMKYIRAAVQRTHGVNLREQSDLHWWKFLDMFIDLDEDTLFSRMLQLRHAKAKGKLTKEEKKLWAEMKDILVLKTPETLQAEIATDEIEKELTRLESLSKGKG